MSAERREAAAAADPVRGEDPHAVERREPAPEAGVAKTEKAYIVTTVGKNVGGRPGKTVRHVIARDQDGRPLG